MTTEVEAGQSASTVYGPVESWRLGRSLGVDLLCVNSICSFKCIYCQLGRINLHTMTRRIFVPTERVMADLRASAWQSADVITLSGNGEPTLAANLGEVIRGVRRFTGKPVVVLTNATTLNDPAVRCELAGADKIFCKLDAADERTFRLINRPVEGVTLHSVIEGIKKLRTEYPGWLAVQTMLMPINSWELEELAALLRKLRPDEVQLNTPLRPVPREWSVATRGNHSPGAPNSARLKVIDRDEAERIRKMLHEMTGLRVVSVYRQN
ncbi:MAG TPA: radical SAM protein [Blastocatellia bacterium]|nr:radical SAM protein [Blastocatellia bacterium]